MNLILVEPADFVSDGTVPLHGRRAEHVRTVHRAAMGDELAVGLVDGAVGRGRITRLDDAAVELEVVLDRPPPPASAVTLVLALPRPKVLRRLLPGVAAFGIKRIVLLHAYRVEKSYWASPLLQPTSLRAALLLGLEQARDTIVPRVYLARRFRPYVEDELDTLAGAGGRLVGDASGAPCPAAVDGPLTLVVGPEGGFISFELELLGARGFTAVSLGPRALRVEHAVPALLGRLRP